MATTNPLDGIDGPLACEHAARLSAAAREYASLRWWQRLFETAEYRRRVKNLFAACRAASQQVEHGRMDEADRYQLSYLLGRIEQLLPQSRR